MNLVDLNWQHAAKVWWCIVWRGVLIGGGLGFLVGILVGIIGMIMGVDQSSMLWVARILGVFVGIPVGVLVTLSALRKEYSDIRIVLVSVDGSITSDA